MLNTQVRSESLLGLFSSHRMYETGCRITNCMKTMQPASEGRSRKQKETQTKTSVHRADERESSSISTCTIELTVCGKTRFLCDAVL